MADSEHNGHALVIRHATAKQAINLFLRQASIVQGTSEGIRGQIVWVSFWIQVAVELAELSSANTNYSRPIS
jgi:hypothetical protein